MKHVLASPPYNKLAVRPTDRELRWFAQIDRHGPQSSAFLFEATRDTHRCKDTALRRMQALREAGYLRLPPQQRQIANADFNPYVYDLTKLGWDCLADYQDLERHCRPTGHWWHGYCVSAISSAIEITATRAGLTYIPAARILALRGVEMAIPISGSKLIPDQLFALKYPDGYRAFALEVDRGTEPVRSGAARKSLARSVVQYQSVLAQQLHKQHYGLKSNLAVLWIFSSARRQMQFRDLVGDDQRFRTAWADLLFPRFAEVVENAKTLVDHSEVQ
ncbi:replication-relaxation family protein [Loktanella sp. Alg231-35]|uniref:replication-relaxation family protein n=1 Tax=Loktanella sp. Alg231-35 TaxID=1922220 RepID=UPI000D551916|nr:replication-relaxation family protein [Loktanella sp. Alg231-35]